MDEGIDDWALAGVGSWGFEEGRGRMQIDVDLIHDTLWVLLGEPRFMRIDVMRYVSPDGVIVDHSVALVAQGF